MNIWDALTCDLTATQLKTIRTFCWRAISIIFMVFSMDLMAPVGVRGFARADDADRKILPLTAQIAQLTQTVAEQSKIAKEQSLQLLTSAIIDAETRQCTSMTKDSRSAYAALVRNLQQRYYALAQQSFTLPSCQDL